MKEASVTAEQAAVRAASAARRAVKDAGRTREWGPAVRANQYALRAIHAAENGEAGKAEASARLAEAEVEDK